MTDQNKIIDRIEKLMAMANDSSSPNEAAIALNRAQKLMTQHQISQDTLQLNQVKEETSGIISKNRKAFPVYLANLCVALGNVFECRPLVENSQSGMSVTYCGIQPGPSLAKYATAVLARQLTKARQDYLRSLPKRLSNKMKTDAANSFALGWVNEAARKANALNPKIDPEKEALIKRYIQQNLDVNQDQQTTHQRHHYADCMGEGAAAAKNIRLNHGMDGEGQGKIGGLA